MRARQSGISFHLLPKVETIFGPHGSADFATTLPEPYATTVLIGKLSEGVGRSDAMIRSLE
jgi:hypothetical protein